MEVARVILAAFITVLDLLCESVDAVVRIHSTLAARFVREREVDPCS